MLMSYFPPLNQGVLIFLLVCSEVVGKTQHKYPLRGGIWQMCVCVELRHVGNTCTQSGTLPLEPHEQSIFILLFWRWGFENYLPGLALNRDPPDLSLQSS
jgi:hypothetical protein